MDGMMFAEQLRSGLVLWDVEQMFHSQLSAGVVEALAALGIETLDRELISPYPPRHGLSTCRCR